MVIPRYFAVTWKGFDDLLCSPLTGGMVCDVGEDNSASIERDDDKAIQRFDVSDRTTKK